MPKAKGLIFIGMVLVCWAATMVSADETKTAAVPPVPTPGMVTMVDLGAHKCIPCKMMAPIIAELQKVYAGRASIIFIDVWQHQDQARKYGIRAIPTQIFYDKNGQETSRHLGYLDKESIVTILENMGVPRKAKR